MAALLFKSTLHLQVEVTIPIAADSKLKQAWLEVDIDCEIGLVRECRLLSADFVGR